MKAIDAIRKALEAGPTPGPWVAKPFGTGGCWWLRSETPVGSEFIETFYATFPRAEANVDYIASVNPAAITELLASHDSLAASNAEMRAALAELVALNEADESISYVRGSRMWKAWKAARAALAGAKP